MSKKLVRYSLNMFQKLADESYEYDDEKKDECEKDVQIEDQ